MAPEKQIGVRGKVINSQSREVIANVLKFMKKEAVKGAPIIPITSYKQRLMEATGISDRVYRQISKDMELIEAGKISRYSSPSRGTRPSCTVEVIDGSVTSGETIPVIFKVESIMEDTGADLGQL